MPGNVEFKDHRTYVPGDDLRFLDWNVFLRSGALAVKTFTHEEAPEAVIVLDRSASMGPPGSRQDALAREIAAAFGFLALRAGGEVVLRCAGGAAAPGAAAASRSRVPSMRGSLAVEKAPGAAGPGGLDALERARGAVRTRAGSSPGSRTSSSTRCRRPPSRRSRASASQRFAFIVCAHDDVLAPASGPGDRRRCSADCRGRRPASARAATAGVALPRSTTRGAEHVAAVTALATRHQFIDRRGVGRDPASRSACVTRAAPAELRDDASLHPWWLLLLPLWPLLLVLHARAGAADATHPARRTSCSGSAPPRGCRRPPRGRACRGAISLWIAPLGPADDRARGAGAASAPSRAASRSSCSSDPSASMADEGRRTARRASRAGCAEARRILGSRPVAAVETAPRAMLVESAVMTHAAGVPVAGRHRPRPRRPAAGRRARAGHGLGARMPGSSRRGSIRSPASSSASRPIPGAGRAR